MASRLAPGAGLRRTRRVALKQLCILLLSLFASAAFAAQESLDGCGFKAGLPVDEDGIVLDGKNPPPPTLPP
jgi:hypothetical protein